jgi:quercetin dioxygenase-like cupin family protein
MRHPVLLVGAIVFVVGVGAAAAQEPAPAAHTAVTPADFKWGPPPPALPAGAQAAVLHGDPGKEGPFVVRVKFPDGYAIQPHRHPNDEHVTILEGELHYAMGEKFDASALRAYPVGSFLVARKEMAHFVRAKGATMIQIHGIGPFTLTYVNAADDPRNKKPSQ